MAPLDGEVWNVKDDSNEGGEDDKYADWKYQNIITIKHDNEEYSQFAHLAHRSTIVKIGDMVKKGDKIAKGIGMTGCTTAPHLHMMVCKIKNNEVGYNSLEIRFNEKFNIIRSGKEHIKELLKPKYKRLKELAEKY